MFPSTDFASVEVDFRQGGHLAIEHLTQLGHRDIGYLSVEANTHSVQEKLAGLVEGCARFGVRPHPLSLPDAFTMREQFEVGATAIRRLLAATPGITAFCALNDLIAVGAMRAARTLGKQVPADISIMGFDNDPLGECLETSPDHPALRCRRTRQRRLCHARTAHARPGTHPFPPCAADSLGAQGLDRPGRRTAN